jgi:hypothetical protein
MHFAFGNYSIQRHCETLTLRSSRRRLTLQRLDPGMGTLIISHRVKDYSTWRPVFDRHTKAQKSAGLTNPRVFRSSDDKNEVVILFDTDDTKKAKDFVASPDLKETMAKAGVTDSPTFYFLESAEPLRVMGTGWIELFGLHDADGAK